MDPEGVAAMRSSKKLRIKRQNRNISLGNVFGCA